MHQFLINVYIFYFPSLQKFAHAINRDFFSAVNIEKFTRKSLIFFLFLLKTLIVGTRVPIIYVLEHK